MNEFVFLASMFASIESFIREDCTTICMNDQILQKTDISFACPDCEFGEMHEIEWGTLPYHFVCDSCRSSIVYSKKTYSYMHRKAFKLPKIKQNVDQIAIDNISDHSYPTR